MALISLWCKGLYALWRQTPVVVVHHYHSAAVRTPRTYIVRRSAERFRRLVVGDAFFAHPEVGDFYVTVFVEHDVVEFQVAIDDAAVMQVEEADGDFRRVKHGHWLFELAALLDLHCIVSCTSEDEMHVRESHIEASACVCVRCCVRDLCIVRRQIE